MHDSRKPDEELHETFGHSARARFQRFIGVSLGGGRGKTTAVARLEPGDSAGSLALVEARARTGHRGGGTTFDEAEGSATPYRDEVLIAAIESHLDDDTVVAFDVPLTLPPCVRCRLACPGIPRCEVPTVRWMRRHGPALAVQGGRSDPGKPSSTPYTQRATELLLERATLQPREALGQGMGPLAARATYLRRRLSPRLRLHENLIEVHPRATLIRWFGADTERRSRIGDRPATWELRKRMLASMTEGLRLDRVWPEVVVRNVHVFHAVVATFTARLWALEDWRGPAELMAGLGETRDSSERARVADAVAELGTAWVEDGWIWTPPKGLARRL